MQTVKRYWVGFGDIHEDMSALDRLADVLRGAAGVLISGDLTNRGGAAKAQAILDRISAYNLSVHAQIGNMDKADVDELFTRLGVNMHAQGVDLGQGVGLLGVGWSTPTPFGTPSEAPERDIAAWLDKAHAQVKDLPRLILVSHTPPFDTRTDLVGGGTPVGSRSVRDFIERVQPDICLTGHIHESVALDRIGRTIVLNPGAFGAGGYAVISQDGDSLGAELAHI